jgi:hypothetical protein
VWPPSTESKSKPRKQRRETSSKSIKTDVACLAYCSTLWMEAEHFSETLNFCWVTRRHIPGTDDEEWYEYRRKTARNRGRQKGTQNITKSRDSSVSTVTEKSGTGFPSPLLHSVQTASGDDLGVRRPRLEDDHRAPSGDEVHSPIRFHALALN